MNKNNVSKHLLCSRTFLNEINELIKPLTSKSPVQYFSYNRYYRDQRWIGIYSNPDPVETSLLAGNGPLFVNKNGVAIKPGCYFHDDLKETLKVKVHNEKIDDFFEQKDNPEGKKIVQNGLLIIRKGENYDDSYYFSMYDGAPFSRAYYKEFTELFQRFSLYFLYKGKEMIKFAENQKVPFDVPEQGAQIFSQLFFNDDKLSKLAEIKTPKFGFSTGCGDVYLSRQELNCLRLLSSGHTYEQIAEDLGLSFKTVESYISNLKNKLNAQNRAKLISYYDKFSVLDFELMS